MFATHDSDAIQPVNLTVAAQDRRRSQDRNLAELDRRRDEGTIDVAIWYRGRSLISAEEFALNEFDLDCRDLFESALGGETAWDDLPEQLAAVTSLKSRRGQLSAVEAPARIAQVRLQQRENFLRRAQRYDLAEFSEAQEALRLVEWILRINPEHAESQELREKIETLHPRKQLTSSLGIELIEIRPGQFNMGSPLSEQGRELDELTHAVRISAPILMGLHEVTHGQFAEFVAATKYQTQAERNGSAYAVKEGKLQSVDGLTWKNPGFVASDGQPVVCVTRDDALKFCSWLSKQEGRQYSLPTEAQWVYACLGGTIQSRFWGDTFEAGDGFCVSRHLTSDIAAPQPVGSSQPNPVGLFDMLGNVQELCLSRYGEYPSLFVENPVHSGAGSRGCVRGGSWLSVPAEVRAASRGFAPFDQARTDVGFRVVCRPN
jgi:sulfatase modifying factor 1